MVNSPVGLKRRNRKDGKTVSGHNMAKTGKMANAIGRRSGKDGGGGKTGSGPNSAKVTGRHMR